MGRCESGSLSRTIRMASFNEIYDEVEQLRGLITAFGVCYPDTQVRTEPCIEKIDRVLQSPSDQSVYYLVEDLQNFLVYLGEVVRIAPELNKQTTDLRMMINRLLGPTNPDDKQH